MSTLNFIFNGNKTSIQYSEGDYMKDICQKFSSKIGKNIENLFFLSGGKILNIDLSFDQISNQLEKNNGETNVLAYEKMNDANGNNPLIKSKDIICPKCKDNCILSIKDYKIILSDCKNGHTTDNILFEEFKDKQIIDESKILCNICNNNKSNIYKKEFYKCLTCKNHFCPLCKSKHEKNHIIIDYDKRNYICNIHNELYISYCNNCRNNLCMQCEIAHKNHKIMPYNNIICDINELKNKLNEYRKKIDEMNKYINDIIKKLSKISENMESFYKILNDMINNYDIKNRNYEIFKNLNYFQNDIEFKEIDAIINNKNIFDKFKYILNIYNKMEKKNEVTIGYLVKGYQGIRLFSEDFVKNNKENCILSILGKENQLTEYLNVSSMNNQDILEIKLKEIKPITNMFRMFRDCFNLVSLPDFSEWDTSKVTNMHSLFNGCSSLSLLSDISKWNTSNVTDIKCMFWNCKLNNLPDISKWDVSKVNNMSGLFSRCSNLKSLPDISKWDTSQVTDMSSIFSFCTSLLKLPDISKWNTCNITDMSKLFRNCSSLTSLPDISKWKIDNVNNFSGMFDGLNKNIIIPKKFLSKKII